MVEEEEDSMGMYMCEITNLKVSDGPISLHHHASFTGCTAAATRNIHMCHCLSLQLSAPLSQDYSLNQSRRDVMVIFGTLMIKLRSSSIKASRLPHG